MSKASKRATAADRPESNDGGGNRRSTAVPAGAQAVDGPISRKAYDKALSELHEELVQLQFWVQKHGLKVCILFEGRDGAGKGGTIKALTERVSPRVFRVSSPCPRRTSARRARCTSSATCCICPRPARS